VQLGSPWLPIPHVLLLPFVRIDSLWRSGLAAAFPSAICFVAGGVFFFAAVRRIFESTTAAAAATALVGLNPNLLYLQSTSMTEAIFFGFFMALLYFTVRESPVGAGIAACGCTLTRYEGWFVLPVVAIYFLRRGGWRPAIVFSLIAGAGPVYWLWHNRYLTGDPLYFFRGPGSAIAIQGNAPYPGKGNWPVALFYYLNAVLLCAGPLLLALGIAGAIVRRAFWPMLLLSLPPVFYVWSIHSAGLPIHIPYLEPHGHYNTRYGLGALPLLALAAAGLATARRGALVVVAIATLWWLAIPRPDRWITWAESRVNSIGRRAWIDEAAAYLAPRYVRGSGIVTSWDLIAIYRKIGLPLRETLNVCDGSPYHDAIGRPDLHLWQEWAVAVENDPVDRAVQLAAKYDLEKSIAQPYERVVKIYHRRK
jgi:hypothetical protein